MVLYRLIFSCSKELARKLIQRDEKDDFCIGCGAFQLNEKYETIYNMEKEAQAIISDVSDERITVALAYDVLKISLQACMASLAEEMPGAKLVQMAEITVDEFKREVLRADKHKWLDEDIEFILLDLGLDITCEQSCTADGDPIYKISEIVYSAEDLTQKKSQEQLSDIMASDSFREEIERIYSKENEKKFYGHPVHYLITAGDKAAAEDMIAVLVPALLKNKRLPGGRVCSVYDLTVHANNSHKFKSIFSAVKGETVVIYLSIQNDEPLANPYQELLQMISRKLGECGNDTLFIFVDISGQRNIADDAVATLLQNADMIRLDEGYGDVQKARAYLKKLADKTQYTDYTEEDLNAFLSKDKIEYTVSDIYNAYNQWFGLGLKTHVYKAYKEQNIAQFQVKKRDNRPYDALQKMVGLKEVKKVTDEIIAAARMRRVRKSLGFEDENAAMHMLFSGNPGSAKTTVARLLAQILKDEEILKNGQLIECGRQDLVGKYVGWTAKIVERKFRAARGGILFIDEAYSLLEDRNSYGAEAINTIVQMMENYREDVLVIFAGYPEKMQQFLEKNEGLRSRIAFHLNFPDYNADELLEILRLMAEKKCYQLADAEAECKCHRLFEGACREENFGNGRYARNLLEHAIMRQAQRMYMDMDGNREISKEEAMILTADDFEKIEMRKTHKKIGFATA